MYFLFVAERLVNPLVLEALFLDLDLNTVGSSLIFRDFLGVNINFPHPNAVINFLTIIRLFGWGSCSTPPKCVVKKILFGKISVCQFKS